MELNTLRMVVEVLAFVSFLAIVAWAWSARNRERFEEAARLPFEDVVANAPSPDRHVVAKAPSPDKKGHRS